MRTLLLLVLGAAFAAASNNVWAVLVAGSNTWGNYRHQADICHHYQILKSKGVPDEHIIVLHYDDIANNARNPAKYKGTIINEPGGSDVYHGVPKDYTGKDVTPDNFLKVLRGETPSVGSGKTLKSTTADHVYVVFSDHGGAGILGFPSGQLSWQPLAAAINTASEKGLFGKLVFYVEACYAGSMFYKATLPANVYIATASPVSASSYAYQWDAERSAYLADIWVWNMMHFQETNPQLTLQDEFDWSMDNIQNYSMACQYGDISIAKSTINEFFGVSKKVVSRAQLPADAVPAWSVMLEAARKIYAENPTEENLAELQKEQRIHNAIDAMAGRIAKTVPADNKVPCTTCDNTCTCIKNCGMTEHCKLECCNEAGCLRDKANSAQEERDSCFFELSDAFLETCGNGHEYLASLYQQFFRMCRTRVGRASAALAVKTIRSECSLLNL